MQRNGPLSPSLAYKKFSSDKFLKGRTIIQFEARHGSAQVDIASKAKNTST